MPKGSQSTEEVVDAEIFDDEENVIEAGGMLELDDLPSEDIETAVVTIGKISFEVTYDITRITPAMISGMRRVQLDQAPTARRRRTTEQELAANERASTFFVDSALAIVRVWPLTLRGVPVELVREQVAQVPTTTLGAIVGACLDPGKE